MGTSATWAQSATHNGDQERQVEALVPSSSQMDQAHPQRVQNPTRDQERERPISFVLVQALVSLSTSLDGLHIVHD